MRIETQRLNILPQLTQLLRAGLRTGPLWSNLESRRCDDPEGAAETRRAMLSQAHTRKHTYARGLHFEATEVRGNQRASRRLQRRVGVYKEEKPHFPGGRGIPFPGESVSNPRFLSLDPGTDLASELYLPRGSANTGSHCCQ